MNASVAKAARGFLAELTNQFASQHAAALQQIEDKADADFDTFLHELSDPELEALLTTIRARRSQLSVGAAYGNEVVATSKQILAFGGAGIGLAAAFLQKLADVPPFILKAVAIVALFYGNLILLSLFIIFSFAWQARFRYPFLYFKRIGNTLPFFYYKAISANTPRSMFQDGAEKELAASLYAKNLIDFVRYHVDSVKSPLPPPAGTEAALSPTPPFGPRAKERVVRDELQQYFLILSYQGYVNQYEVTMNNHFLYGIIGASLAALVLGIVMFV